MHLGRISLFPERFPAPVTFFIGENGNGKSTLLKAVSRKCGYHIWDEAGSGRGQFIIATHSPILNRGKYL